MHGPLNVKLVSIPQEIIIRFLGVTEVVNYVFCEVRN